MKATHRPLDLRSSARSTLGLLLRLLCAPLATSFLFVGFWSCAAQPLTRPWQWRSPLPQGNDLCALTHAAGRFLAVGDYGTILSSSDGVKWTNHGLQTEAALNGVAYGHGTWVAVGQGYWQRTSGTPGTDYLLSSADGTNWTDRSTGQTSYLRSVAFGNDVFVAVGSSWPYSWPYTNSIFTSSDGVNWVARTAATNTSLSKVTFANGRFVAVGEGLVQTSLDGISWSAFPALGNLSDVTFGAGVWVAVGALASNGWVTVVASSVDATNWTPRHVGAPGPVAFAELGAVAFGNNRFVAMGRTYTGTGIEQNVRLGSEDGLNWAGEPGLDTLLRPKAIQFANDTFVAVGEFGNISSSEDGTLWTGRSTASPNNLRGLTYGNGTFVALGNNGTNLTSTDGLSWEGHLTGTGRNLREATFATSQFVAVGSSGTILTSPDGATWTAQASGTTESLWDIAVGNGMLVAVGGDSIGESRILHRFSLLTSNDGTNWTTRLTSPDYTYDSFELHGIVYGAGQFVAVGRPSAILTSTDGLRWVTNRMSPVPGAYLKGIAYGAGQFVAIGETTHAWTSTDGSNWVVRSLPMPPYTQLDDVTFGDGAFVAVGDGGLILTSSNGVDWLREQSPTSTNLRDVAYGGGSFVIVGNNDHILQSGTNATAAGLRIVVQPQSHRVAPGADVSFEVLAQGNGALTYQWQRNGVDLPGASEAKFTLSNVQVEDNGYFSVVVADGTNTLRSETVFLLVTPVDPFDAWSLRVSSAVPPWVGVTFADHRYVAVGGSAAWTSLDAIRWSSNTTPANALQDVTFGNGLFVACGNGIATSSNGSHWIARTAGVPFALTGVAWGGGRFVAVGGAGTSVATSADGLTWQPAPLPASFFLRDVAYGNGQFVAVGDFGSVVSSTDGLGWTRQNSATNAVLFGIAYGNGKFVAVGGPRLILTSPNAVVWTARTNAASPASGLLGVAFAHGQFVALANDGTVLSSVDGVSWRVHFAAVLGGLRVAGGPDSFVAVGNRTFQSGYLVPAPPQILAEPRGGAPLVGTAYTLSVAAVGTPPLRYQWRHNGTDLPGATASNYTVAGIQITNEGTYQVEVSNPFGSAIRSAEVWAGVAPTFLQQPISQSVVVGETVTLSAVVTGRPPPFLYVWRHEGTTLRVGSTSSEPSTFHRYSAPSLITTQRFRVVISNAATAGLGVISDFATVRVLADTDGDKLPDEWEHQFGFSPTDASDSAEDRDEDGLPNSAEYLAGTSPTNAMEVLRLDLVEWSGAGTRLFFTARSNKTYTVQSRAAPDTGLWQPVADVAATTTTRTVEIRHPLNPHGSSRFYRLVTPRSSDP